MADEFVSGLTNASALALDRFPIRTRASSSTQSGWRLSVRSDEGDGSIVFVEVTSEETLYRGDGVFLGWSQDRMAAAYQALLPEPEPDGFEMPQMG